MKKHRFLTVWLIITPLLMPDARAQESGVYVTLGGASYRMGDMKYLQNLLLEQYPVEGRITSSFPAYGAASVGLVRRVLPHLTAGAGYSYTTTGGRSNYTDYSGRVTTELTLVSHSLGAWFSYGYLDPGPFEFSIYGAMQGNLSSMDLISAIYVPGYTSGVRQDFRSFSPHLSAGLEVLVRLGDISAGLHGGYLVDLTGELKDRETGSPLEDPRERGRILTSDWTGWRAGLRLILWFP